PIVPVANGYKRILTVINNGESLYKGMQLNLTKRFSHHFSMLASYTWSHTTNTVEPDAPGGDANDANQLGAFERGDSILDQRHRLALSGWWALPQHFVSPVRQSHNVAAAPTSRQSQNVAAGGRCRNIL